MKIKICFILAVIFLNFFSTGRSLQFSLSGDDWLALYRYITTFHTFFDHFNISKYMGNYDAANILMGLIYRIFEFNPFPYYLTSFIFRILASLSFYPIIFALTKNKLASVLSVLFFSINYIGIETTNWVFNMTTYISVSLFNLFLYLNIKEVISFKSMIKQAIIVFLAFFFTPNRMHALVFITPLIEILRFKFGYTKNLRSVIIRIALFLAPIIIFRRLTATDWDETYYHMAGNFLFNLKDYFFSFLADVGTAIIPDRFLYLIFGSVSVVNFIKIATGIIFLSIFPIFFLVMRRKYQTLSIGGILAISFSLFFLLAPWLIFSNGAPFLSDSRYLTIPAAYFALSTAFFITIIWQEKRNIYSSIAVLIITSFLISNLISLDNYFDFYLENGRDSVMAKNIFNQILPYINSYDDSVPLVFLFIGDYDILYNSITFGFSYHLILTHPVLSQKIPNTYLPLVVDNIESLREILSDPNGNEMRRYGYKDIKISFDNIYGFQLQNGKIVNVTAQLKEYLKDLLSDSSERL